MQSCNPFPFLYLKNISTINVIIISKGIELNTCLFRLKNDFHLVNINILGRCHKKGGVDLGHLIKDKDHSCNMMNQISSDLYFKYSFVDSLSTY